MKVTLILAAILLQCSFAIAREGEPDECDACKCPKAKIHVKSLEAKEGDIVVFEVFTVDSKLRKCSLTYDWHVSNGEIVNGRRTKKIRLKVPKGSAGTTITVAVSVNGERGCEGTPSETIEIGPQ